MRRLSLATLAQIPLANQMLAQMLMLRFRQDEFVAKANVQRVDQATGNHVPLELTATFACPSIKEVAAGTQRLRHVFAP